MNNTGCFGIIKPENWENLSPIQRIAFIMNTEEVSKLKSAAKINQGGTPKWIRMIKEPKDPVHVRKIASILAEVSEKTYVKGVIILENAPEVVPVIISGDTTINREYCKIKINKKYKNATIIPYSSGTYFLEDSLDMIKVGKAEERLEDRIYEIARMNSHPVKIISLIPDVSQERAQQEKYSRWWGEWRRISEVEKLELVSDMTDMRAIITCENVNNYLKSKYRLENIREVLA